MSCAFFSRLDNLWIPTTRILIMANRNAIASVQEGFAAFFSLLGVMMSAALLAKQFRWCSKTKRLVPTR
jgi:hypothetical protein